MELLFIGVGIVGVTVMFFTMVSMVIEEQKGRLLERSEPKFNFEARTPEMYSWSKQ